MEIPALVRQALGDEEVQAGVSLGDEDAACFTPTRTLVYRGEGLLSDEDVVEYPHDFERLSVSEGRRKSKFTLAYVDGKEELAVPSGRTEPVLERLLEGHLSVAGVIEPDESVEGVFRFSELTLIVAQRRLVKHVGESTWDEDFEVFPFAEVTGLSFEDGSVATSVVLEVGGRPQRIKAPNEQAPKVRRTLQEALFAYHGVGSLDELNRAVAPDEEAESGDGNEAAGGQAGSSGLGLDADIDPLVGDSGDDAGTAPDGATSPGADASGAGGADPSASEASAGEAAPEEDVETAQTVVDPSGSDGGAPAGGSGGPAGEEGAATDRAANLGSAGGSPTEEDVEAISQQLTVLTEAVERQNQLLEQQQQTVRQLIEELRRGR